MKLFGQELPFKAIVEKFIGDSSESFFYFKNVDLTRHKKFKFKDINGTKSISTKNIEALVTVPEKAKFSFAISKNYIGLAWETTMRYGFTVWDHQLEEINSITLSKKSLPKELKKHITRWDTATLLNFAATNYFS